MAKRNSGEQKPKLTILDAQEILFQLDGQTLNVEDASDEQFDRFIRQHIQIGWSLEDRIDAINTALARGKTLGVVTPEKSNHPLIFSEGKTAQEA